MHFVCLPKRLQLRQNLIQPNSLNLGNEKDPENVRSGRVHGLNVYDISASKLAETNMNRIQRNNNKPAKKAMLKTNRKRLIKGKIDKTRIEKKMKSRETDLRSNVR